MRAVPLSHIHLVFIYTTLSYHDHIFCSVYIGQVAVTVNIILTNRRFTHMRTHKESQHVIHNSSWPTLDYAGQNIEHDLICTCLFVPTDVSEYDTKKTLL